jgi:6-pyruvoyltetrahydropterin/6-carboxytetrahydropterin synthase
VRKLQFCAAHRLHNPAKSDEWNRTTFGLCNNPSYHGHNYELEITVEGEIDPETGYVVDADRLRRVADEHIVAHLDHKNLNIDVPWFAHRLTSAEHVAMFCWDQLASRIPAGTLTSIRLAENAVNSVEYRGA